MMDKSLPHIGVIMVKNNPSEYPEFKLPEGYSYCMYQNGLEIAWSNLQVSVDHFNMFGEALDYFKKEFMCYPDELTEKCVFVKDNENNIIATASLWRGNHFNKELQRVHWVAVHPDHQGKGIAKALITKVLDIYNKLGYKDFIYLTTQTWSYKAINIYMEFGFKPYLEDKPDNWSGNSDEFDKDKTIGWKLIMDKINANKRK